VRKKINRDLEEIKKNMIDMKTNLALQVIFLENNSKIKKKYLLFKKKCKPKVREMIIEEFKKIEKENV